MFQIDAELKVLGLCILVLVMYIVYRLYLIS